MAQNDYAILVGISRYADKKLPSLKGPVNDVALIHRWLVDEKRCAVPSDNIKTIVSKEIDAMPPANGELPPLLTDFCNVFRGIAYEKDTENLIRRETSRLYLYFSGHGFGEKKEKKAHATLYAANACGGLHWNICGTQAAQWAKENFLFREIVLIMDCCRDAQLLKQVMKLPLKETGDTEIGRNSHLFELYAALRGATAVERPSPAHDNRVHGLFTTAFLDAIEHAEPNQPSLQTADIRRYLWERWTAICHGEPVGRPEVIVPSDGEFTFHRPVASGLPQRFRIMQLGAGNSFEIYDSNDHVVTHGTLDGEQARLAWDDGHTSTAPIRDGIFEIPLPATDFYVAEAAVRDNRLRRPFQPGGADVKL
jgi:hypothetical protein